MKLGLTMPNMGPLADQQTLVVIADSAEALGYESIWVSDHVLVPNALPVDVFGRVLESMTTLAYLAAHTERIGLGTGVLVLPQRDPVLVAKQAATLDHLSAGRLSLAVAVGWLEQEYRFLRSDFHTRGIRAYEYVEVLRKLLDEQSPRHTGPEIHFSDAYFAPRPSHRLPILLGGSSEAALRRAATLGDGWYGWKQTPAEAAAAVEALRGLGAPDGFDVSLRARAKVGDDLSEGAAMTTIGGGARSVAGQIDAYRRSGVDRLVIDPVAATLDDFLTQIGRLAEFMDEPARVDGPVSHLNRLSDTDSDSTV
jgi:probable F420-dependent oxidoreductase